jgi:hypothetical protein
MSVPIVPLSAFSNLAGPALADDLRRLLASPGLIALVLFSDTLGEQLALLPVGPDQAFANIDDVGGREIEGLRPLCALRLRGGGKTGRAEDEAREAELERRETALKKRERELEEREQSLAEREQMLVEKEREFFRRSGETARQTVNA